jgi:hypothetical protein
LERSRIFVAVAIAVAPIAGLIGFGCSEDETPTVGMTKVDPGGTFGAEVQIRVVGRGSVRGSIPQSIDCPGDCYARYTFNTPGDKGAAEGLTLKATPTEGARFVGWTFEAEQLGTKGRGPDNCSPVKRPTSQPGDNANPELKLTFGEVSGTAPPGQEGACVGDFLKVPVAYKLVARFEDPPPLPEAGPDVLDGGDGGTGPGTVLFETPAIGATGGEIFLISGRLYWRYTTSGGQQGIATGLTSAIAGSQPLVVLNPTTITRFEGDQANVSYQTGGGAIGVFNASNPTIAVTSYASPPTCDALESYSTSNLFCLSGTTLYSWPISGGSQTIVTTAVPATPAGRNFAITSSYFWVVNDPLTTNGASIQRLSRSAVADGGPQAWESNVITMETNPTRLLTTSAEYLAWVEFNAATDIGEVHASTGSGAPATVYVPVPAEAGLKLLAPDSLSSYVIAGVSPLGGGTGGKIYRTSATTNTGALTPAVTGIPNLTGIAADSSYYYWTQNDGRVYRRFK